MGLFSSIAKVVNNVAGFNDFSGKSQQKDANQAAMTAWSLMNDYNHPIQQMERLKAAGLNPLLVYGSGSVSGNTTSSPSLVGGNVATPLETLTRTAGKTLSLLQGQATLDQTNATAAASRAAAGASGAQAANLNAQAALNETRNKYEQKSLIADIDYKRALADKTRAEASIAQGEAEIFGATGGTKGVKAGVDVVRGAARTLRGIFGK